MTEFVHTAAVIKADFLGKDFKKIVLSMLVGFLIGAIFTVQIENDAKTSKAYEKADTFLTQVK